MPPVQERGRPQQRGCEMERLGGIARLRRSTHSWLFPAQRGGVRGSGPEPRLRRRDHRHNGGWRSTAPPTQQSVRPVSCPENALDKRPSGGAEGSVDCAVSSGDCTAQKPPLCGAPFALAGVWTVRDAKNPQRFSQGGRLRHIANGARLSSADVAGGRPRGLWVWPEKYSMPPTTHPLATGNSTVRRRDHV